MDKATIRAIIATLGQLDIKPTRANTNILEAVYQKLDEEMEKEDAHANQNEQRKDA